MTIRFLEGQPILIINNKYISKRFIQRFGIVCADPDSGVTDLPYLFDLTYVSRNIYNHLHVIIYTYFTQSYKAWLFRYMFNIDTVTSQRASQTLDGRFRNILRVGSWDTFPYYTNCHELQNSEK